MSYVNPNYKSKKLFKEAIAKGVKHHPYSPGPFGSPQNGSDCIEGPHYPQPHRWYASVKVVDGIVVECEKVKLPTAEELDKRKLADLGNLFTVGAVLESK